MSLVTFAQGSGFFVDNGHSTTIGVIVLQEWWGLNEQIKGIAKKFADQGFMALAPDLYRGRVAVDADEASHLMDGLDWDAAMEDITCAIKFLREKGAKKVAVMGFCLGGALTIAAACKVSHLDGGICFYGVPSKAICDPKDVACPLQLHFGDHDKSTGFSDPKTAEDLETALADNKKTFEIYRYDADHAFMNEKRPEVFNKAVSELAFDRTCNFLTNLVRN